MGVRDGVGRRTLRIGAVALAVIAAFGAGTGGDVRAAAKPVTPPPARTAIELANPFRTGQTLVIPHGGGDGLFPENTMFAYERSTAMGGQVIDVDVRVSGDGVLIAFHDVTLERTTNGTGRVDRKPYAELAKLDAGYDFTLAGKHPYRGKNLRIPTLETVLKRFPSMLVTLDVKDERESLAKPLCELITGLGRADNVYIGTDSTAQVEIFRTACPAVRTSGTMADRRAMRAARDAADTSFVTKQRVSQPEYRASDGTMRITPEYLAFAHSKGIAVLTWVVDSPNDMATLIAMGVDGIYTRRPDVLVKVLQDAQRPSFASATPKRPTTTKPTKPTKDAVGVPASTRQLVIGVADDWTSSSATLQRYARKVSGGPWVAVGAPFPARLGPNGLAWGIGKHATPKGGVTKREGDDRSPAGIFGLSTAFGYDASWAKKTKLPYITVGAQDLFVEDPASPFYNSHVRLEEPPATDWERDQQMYQTDPAHRLEVLVDHNRTSPPTPGAGSAIFIHIWRGGGSKATAGCTSVSDADIETLVSWLDPNAKAAYALLPADEYEARQKAWGLPKRTL